MRTVEAFNTTQAMHADHARIARTLLALGWHAGNTVTNPTITQTDHTLTATWQHDTHPHDIVIRYVRNLCDARRWDRQITLVWWHWPLNGDEKTSNHALPTDVPIEAAAGTWDGLPITLPMIIAMCGVVDLREAA